MIPLYIQQFRLGSRSRDFCQFMEGFGLEKLGIGKKVPVSENLVSERNLDFRKFGLGKQVSVSKNLAVYYYKEVRNTVLVQCTKEHKMCYIFIRPESDHWLCFSLTDSLTNSLTLV